MSVSESLLIHIVAIVLAVLCALAQGIAFASEREELPQRLQDTGYPGKAAKAFTPQFQLWTDGAQKRRWIQLPEGASIDAAKPDAWDFPRGTKLWKEFGYAGKPVETRYIEHGRDGEWRFASYVWNGSGTQAKLAPERGTILDVAAAPAGRYAIPARGDCIACHGSSNVPVLGFSALQLSGSLRELVAKGLVRNLPGKLLHEPPQVAAATPVERAALGYLHANCAHCHNTGPNRAPLPLTLALRTEDAEASREEVLRSTLNATTRYRAHGGESFTTVIEPGKPEASVLAQRMATRNPRAQMPPLGTLAPDNDGIALVHRWIGGLKPDHPKEKQP